MHREAGKTDAAETFFVLQNFLDIPVPDSYRLTE